MHTGLGGLVTPPPNRRRRRRKPAKPIIKEQAWIVPVSDDPERRIAVIASQWKLVDASKLALDEQRAWAVVAARSVTPSDVNNLAERIAALQPESRELFLYTCSAENRHRRLRLTALGDLAAQRPSQTTFAMACRLVEAAPTWQQDRGQGVAGAVAGDGRRQDRGAGRSDRVVDVAAGSGCARPPIPFRRVAHHRRTQPAGRARRGRLGARPRRGGGASGADRPGGTAGGRGGIAGGRFSAARFGRRADGGAHPPGAVEGSAAACGGARFQHSGADAAGKVGQAGQAKGRDRARSDGLVQRRGGRIDPAGSARSARPSRDSRSRSRRQLRCVCATTPTRWWWSGWAPTSRSDGA